MDVTLLVKHFNSPSPLVVLDNLLPTRYLLGAQDGSTHRFVLNLEPQVRTGELLDKESRLLQYLAAPGTNKFPYALPLMLPEKTAHLAYLGDLPKGRNWTLRQFIEGVNFDWRRPGWSVQHCFAAGTALAALHNLSYLEGFLSRFPAGALPGEVDYQKICEAGLEKLLVGSEKSLGDKLRKIISKALPYTNVEEQILIHGDWHPGNVLFSPGESGDDSPTKGLTSPVHANGAIDWDYARQGDRIFDLAYALCMFAGTFREGKTSKDAQPDRERELFYKDYAGHFIKGYKQIQCKEIAQENAALTPDVLAQRLTVVLTLILLFELEQREKPPAETNIGGLVKLLGLENKSDKTLESAARLVCEWLS